MDRWLPYGLWRKILRWLKTTLRNGNTTHLSRFYVKRKKSRPCKMGFNATCKRLITIKGSWGYNKRCKPIWMEFLKIEELMWFLCSRTKWLTYGGRSMKYYHMKTIHSRRFSKIIMLKNNLWEWIEESGQLKAMVHDYYKESVWLCKESVVDP